MNWGNSAWTNSRAPREANSNMANRSSVSHTQENSSTPEWIRKHLNPKQPACNSGLSSLRFPGTRPPQNPTSTQHLSCAAASFLWNAATEVVGGMLLSGMSIIVVIPPAAAARVAVENPSQSVRPGSLMWTCVSTSPGMMTQSPASSLGVHSNGPISRMTPARTLIEAG